MLTKNHQLHGFKHEDIYSELRLLRAGKHCYFYVISKCPTAIKIKQVPITYTK